MPVQRRVVAEGYAASGEEKLAKKSLPTILFF
jgi:hypothetical protein